MGEDFGGLDACILDIMERPVIPANFVTLAERELQRISNSLTNYISYLESVIEGIYRDDLTGQLYHDRLTMQREDVQRQVTAIHLIL